MLTIAVAVREYKAGLDQKFLAAQADRILLNIKRECVSFLEGGGVHSSL